MKGIEDRILKDGRIIDNDIICVDSFLNHQMDPAFLREFAVEVKAHYAGKEIDRVLTVETSGIAVAIMVAEELGSIPCVFAKKSKSRTVGTDVYSTKVHSFTRNSECEITVSQKYLHAGENVLIVDDFLADGNASAGLIDLCRQAGADVVGVAVVIEKAFQNGHQRLLDAGIDLFAGASIQAFHDNKPVF